jgi:rod shape-determining protein MreC
MRKKKKYKMPARYLFFGMCILCIVAIVLTFTFNTKSGPINTVCGYVFAPMQKGINIVGDFFAGKGDYFNSLEEMIEKNEQLQAQVDELTTENSTLILELSDLEQLQQLFELDNLYTDYEKVGARIISKDAGNWFSTFLIDKGADDGIETDMNVIAGSGLVGIVTHVGKNYATVRSIIDDTSNVSAQILDTSDNCVVSGSLQSMNQNYTIRISQLRDTSESVKSGAAVVTSTISDKYLPGLLIGYVSELSLDSNNLTKSGTITPVADFEHMQSVLVITTKKTVPQELDEKDGNDEQGE